MQGAREGLLRNAKWYCTQAATASKSLVEFNIPISWLSCLMTVCMRSNRGAEGQRCMDAKMATHGAAHGWCYNSPAVTAARKSVLHSLPSRPSYPHLPGCQQLGESAAGGIAIRV